ncbi:putative TIR domain, P-loop containing nucleoside triphosphate hydrolase [Helianthus annuus]|nr:putative TIR domain, P-loop containing nucleoside triphosphate hydrolase [Helianthus annuus]KAJ0540652.1 putative TIR domain, P-loop containing nucleoside triphosphate hydrolase [Helianthus annuus]KAJ0705802.1 putative TIR domain, P-loop containing nucleoside triphosphate hydrolase [Helianthus annuus]
MASTSTSSIQKSFKYDVFLSFRGEDTLATFVDPLYHALLEKGITTYKADEKFEKEGRIDDQLIRSIHDSRFHIVVFSKNYASSSCCLDELVEIMKCQKTAEQTAYPVFFDVEPTEVGNQSGPVGEAFAKLVAKHEKGSGMFSFFNLFTRKRKRTSEDVDLEKEDNVGRWRNALKEAASLAGMELKNTFNGCEAKYIQQVVEEVSRKLQFFNLSVDGKLVGRETQVIGDGRETTLARNICDHTSIRLEGESSVGKRFKYDVFLSFRGEDTRKTFVDHLYHALHNRGIITYKDDEKIEQAKRINEQLMRSIEDSRIYIIVFSKNYASSSWCLDELVKIMECHKTTGQTAYPVFFNVEPTEVRQQSGAVKEAFAKHEKKEAAGIWRNAMKEAADLAGRELKTTFDGHEAKFIQKIVEDISLELRFIDTSVDEKLIGMETRVKHVVSSLENGSDDVRMIGIKGIGGGGKTTLARAVFDHISVWFEGKSFVENVREASKGSGLKKLQKQVLKDVLNDGRIDVTSVSEGKHMMKKMMGSRKTLVVLDDVDDIEQLEALAGDRTWFKAGSTIIITTRDEHVLVAHRVKSIHDVNLLSHVGALVSVLCLYSVCI